MSCPPQPSPTLCLSWDSGLTWTFLVVIFSPRIIPTLVEVRGPQRGVKGPRSVAGSQGKGEIVLNVNPLCADGAPCLHLQAQLVRKAAGFFCSVSDRMPGAARNRNCWFSCDENPEECDNRNQHCQNHWFLKLFFWVVGRPLASWASFLHSWQRGGGWEIGGAGCIHPWGQKSKCGTSLVDRWLGFRLPVQGVRIPPLVRELRSHMPQGQKPKTRNRSNIITNSIKTLKSGPHWASPGGSGEESACQCGGHGFDLWSRKIPHPVEQLSLCTTTAELVL